jgi:hypothetical protein
MGKFNKQPKELPLQKSLKLSQDFGYTKGEINLNFNVKVEKKNLENFKECLQEAIADVDKTLEELK